ncbi:MAG: hypothetical protein R3B84_24405 [Zavarzinella sp.]
MLKRTKLWSAVIGGLLAVAAGVKAEDKNAASKLLEMQIAELEKTNPAAAALLRQAMKGGQSGSSSSRPGSGGSAKAGGSANGTGGQGTGSTSTFTMSKENEKVVVKATENGTEYELVGELAKPSELTITIGVGDKKKDYKGVKAVPAQQKGAVAKLLKRAAEQEKLLDSLK